MTTSKTAAQAQARVARLAEELKQAKARAQKIAAAERAKVAKVERSRDTRRKVLVGSFVLAHLPEGQDVARLTFGGASLAAYLTRDDDRALFGLPPLSTANTAA